jgi:ubiquinone/menaquinone biosynthesis C-methylase UbiE
VDDTTRLHQRTYDAIAEAYATRFGNSSLWQELCDALLTAMPPGSLVADLGCGPGRDATRFAARGHRVVGVDLSREMLRLAAHRIPHRVVQADLRHLPLANGAFDALWSSAALLHIPAIDTPTVLADFRRILRPGGHLALVTVSGEGTVHEPVAYAPDHTRVYVHRPVPVLRKQLAAAGFRIVMEEQRPTTRDWYVVLAVAG